MKRDVWRTWTCPNCNHPNMININKVNGSWTIISQCHRCTTTVKMFIGVIAVDRIIPELEDEVEL